MARCVCALVIVMGLVGCDSSGPGSSPAPEVARGDVVRVELDQIYTVEEVNQLAVDLGIPLAARYDVHVYLMEYMSVDMEGQLEVVSGAVTVPQPILQLLPVVSFQHGTVVHRSSVPSSGGMDENLLVGILFSADGYLSVLPDLIGLGSSTRRHPYLIAEVSAAGIIDMLRGVTKWTADQSWEISRNIFLTGYSSGGYTAMAAHRALEADNSDEFTVIASAPMAGPYDLSGTMLEFMLRDEPHPSPYYLPYLLLSYNRTYGLFERPSDFLQSPYDEILPPLFDGTHDSGEINAAMPRIPIQIVRPELVQAIQGNPDHPFLQRLRENNLINWTTSTPIQLYHCAADELVPIENSILAARGIGESATLIDPSPQSGHGGCVFSAVSGARAWFNSILTSGQ